MKFKSKIRIVAGIIIISGISMGSIILYNNVMNGKMDTKIEEVKDKKEIKVETQQEFIGEIKSKLSGELIVSRNERKIIHKTVLNQEIPVDMHGETIMANAEIIKYGSGIIQYNYITDLNKSTVSQDGNKITIKLEKPHLDESSVVLKKGTFKLDESRSKISVAAKMVISKEILSNASETYDGKASRILMEEIPKEGINQLSKYKSDNDDINNELITNINNKIKDITETNGLTVTVEYQ